MLYQKVISYCKENNISICSFEKKCGIGNGTVGRWEDGKSNPSLQTLAKIETATGISVAEWLKNEEEDNIDEKHLFNTNGTQSVPGRLPAGSERGAAESWFDDSVDGIRHV